MRSRKSTKSKGKGRIAAPLVALFVLIAVAAGAALIIKDGQEPTPLAPAFTTEPVVTSVTEPIPEPRAASEDNDIVLYLWLDRETGQVSGNVLYGHEEQKVLGDSGTTPLSGSTGGRGVVLPAGSCGYSDPCHDGLPQVFTDDLDGLIGVDVAGSLPVDGPRWYQERFVCYQSPWLVADCNLELALGAYGALAQDGFDDACLATEYGRRMSFDSAAMWPGWWNCESPWWDPTIVEGIRGECERAVVYFRTRSALLEGSGAPEPAGASQEDAAIGPSADVADAGEDDLTYCGTLEIEVLTSGEIPGDLSAPARCRLARVLMRFGKAEADRYVPPCGVSLRSPVDTQQLDRSSQVDASAGR